MSTSIDLSSMMLEDMLSKNICFYSVFSSKKPEPLTIYHKKTPLLKSPVYMSKERKK